MRLLFGGGWNSQQHSIVQASDHGQHCLTQRRQFRTEEAVAHYQDVHDGLRYDVPATDTAASRQAKQAQVGGGTWYVAALHVGMRCLKRIARTVVPPCPAQCHREAARSSLHIHVHVMHGHERRDGRAKRRTRVQTQRGRHSRGSLQRQGSSEQSRIWTCSLFSIEDCALRRNDRLHAGRVENAEEYCRRKEAAHDGENVVPIRPALQYAAQLNL